MLKGKEVKVYDGDLIGWTTGIEKYRLRSNRLEGELIYGRYYKKS